MTKPQNKLSIIAAIAALLTLPISVNAQEEEAPPPPNWIEVRTVNLHTDGIEKWNELQKQLVAYTVERDENQHRHVWEVVNGEMDSFHILAFHQNLSELDEQAEANPPSEEQIKWRNAIAPTVASRTLSLYRYHPDLSIPAEEDATRNLIILRYHAVKTGQSEAFKSWINDTLKPALTKSGVTGVNFSRLAFGGNGGTWVSSQAIDNWATLDGPPLLANLGAKEREAVFASYDDMVSSTEIRLLRFREDLSH